LQKNNTNFELAGTGVQKKKIDLYV